MRRLVRKEWEEHYLEYKTLKKVLKSCKSATNAEHVFLLALDQQLVRSFCAQKKKEEKKKLVTGIRAARARVRDR